MTQTPPPGSFGLATVSGWLGTLISIGQALNATSSPYQHAFLVLDGGQVLEAEPGGARIVPIGDYLARADVGNDVVFCDGPVLDYLAANPRTDPDALRRSLCASAREYEGTPYSFADYASLALHRWGIRPAWVERYVKSFRHAICSQLVDECFYAAGIYLFREEHPPRWPGDVTPGDLDAWRIAWNTRHQ